MEDRLNDHSRPDEGQTGSKAGSRTDRWFVPAVFLLLLLPSFGMLFHPTTENIGNSLLKEKPVLLREDGINRDFLKDAGEWFESVFAFRPEMVTADSLLQDRIYGVSSQDSVVAGKDGWLFYAATENDYTGQEPLSDRMIFNIANNVALLQRYVSSKGASMVFTVAPNKNSLYPEYMPGGYVLTGNPKNADRLAALFRDKYSVDDPEDVDSPVGRSVRYLDLYRLFEEAFAEAGKPLYYERDSHWTEEGAVRVYRALMDITAQSGEAPRANGSAEEMNGPVEESDGPAGETEEMMELPDQPLYSEDFYGDLGKMLYPAGLFPEKRGVYCPDFTWEYTGEAQDVTADRITTANQAPCTYQKLVMYRDSFGNSLLPYFAQTYGDCVFSQKMPYPIDEDMGEDTDIVIVEIVERHLSSLGIAVPLHKAACADPADVAAILSMERVDDPANISTVEKSRNKDYTVFSGILDDRYLQPESRIYVLITDAAGTGSQVYEAYTIRMDGSDYGFSIAFDEEQIKPLTEGGYLSAAVLDPDGTMRILAYYME